MKAAIIYPGNDRPQFTEISYPVDKNNDEIVISVKAVAISHFEKLSSMGKHYSVQDELAKPKVIGGDGVGILEDGTLVYAMGVSGMVAEKAVINKKRMIVLPKGLDPAIASALPNAVIGSAMALLFRAKLEQGETILINGATGFTGKIAVQLARHYGAKRIVVTGRNEQLLNSLLALGADEVVSLKQPDNLFINNIKKIHEITPLDVIIDYLWGHSTELIINSFKGTGTYKHRTRFISIGSMSGETIQLSAQTLRSVDFELSGSGIGAFTKNTEKKFFSEVLPEVFQLAAKGDLKVETMNVNINDVGKMWDLENSKNKRIVILI